jgi:hypothetical protein
MSTASLAPETRDLSGDDAWHVLRRTGRVRLMKDAFQRMRVADGFSHARSFAFMISLVAVQVWCLPSSIALFYGGAVAAKVGAVRAGTSAPQDAAKVASSEPGARDHHPSVLAS